jgi:hypothetical protein
MKKIILVPDLQVPYQDQPKVDLLAKFIKAYKPDNVVSVGDEIDFPTISRWTKGRPGEYERTIGRDRDMAVKVLEQLQIKHMVRSNHTDRLYNTVVSRVPGLLGAPELTLENFLRLPSLGITYHSMGYEVAPNWIVLHGDEGTINSNSGMTALNLAKRIGKSVACGHTHRAGLISYAESYGGKTTRRLYGLEVGNLMDQRKALYLKAGAANWTQAFGILTVEGKSVFPQLIPFVGNSFVVDGKLWN